MNRTAELVKLWAEYEEAHNDCTIEEFCRFYLIKEREEKNKEGFLGGHIPPNIYSTMAKIIGIVFKLNNTYMVIALKECGLGGLEEFLYLAAISNTPNIKKTEVIYSNFSELSSGLLIIERLNKKGFLTEQPDTEDKRSKRLVLSEAGDAVLKECYKEISFVNKLFFNEMPTDDIQLCIQLLTPIEMKFASKWIKDKSKSFHELESEQAITE